MRGPRGRGAGRGERLLCTAEFGPIASEHHSRTQGTVGIVGAKGVTIQHTGSEKVDFLPLKGLAAASCVAVCSLKQCVLGSRTTSHRVLCSKPGSTRRLLAIGSDDDGMDANVTLMSSKDGGEVQRLTLPGAGDVRAVALSRCVRLCSELPRPFQTCSDICPTETVAGWLLPATMEIHSRWQCGRWPLGGC